MRSRIEAELAHARAAREHGKEGRARVCARRAAGWAIAIHFADVQADTDQSTRGALSHLNWLKNHPEAPLELRAAAGRLTEQVDEDHLLPHEEDPLEDAELIVATLLPDESPRQTK